MIRTWVTKDAFGTPLLPCTSRVDTLNIQYKQLKTVGSAGITTNPQIQIASNNTLSLFERNTARLASPAQVLKSSLGSMQEGEEKKRMNRQKLMQQAFVIGLL
jgi:hypothetical protein